MTQTTENIQPVCFNLCRESTTNLSSFFSVLNLCHGNLIWAWFLLGNWPRFKKTTIVPEMEAFFKCFFALLWRWWFIKWKSLLIAYGFITLSSFTLELAWLRLSWAVCPCPTGLIRLGLPSLTFASLKLNNPGRPEVSNQILPAVVKIDHWRTGNR